MCSVAMPISFVVYSLISFGNTLYLSFAAPAVPTVAVAMKKVRDIVQYFNKSTQATKKLKDQQHKSSLAKYSATSAPSERIWSRAARVLTAKRNKLSEEVSSAIMYCKENRELLHKYYAEIAKERMHPDDHHLIEKHKALLPTFEHEREAESNIDVGVDVEEV